MKPVCILQHSRNEGPGFFAQYLAERRIPLRVVRIDEGEPVPRDTAGMSGLCSLGGMMSANDPLPWIDDEIRLLREAMARDLPVIGHCLGGQLIAKALGGTVTANPVPEIGWHPVEPVDSDAAREWLGGLTGPVPVFHWHYETFSLPEGAVHLLRSRHCANQAFAIRNTLALQCHVEVDAAIVAIWVETDGKHLVRGSASEQSGEEMLVGLHERVAVAQGLARRLYDRWAAPLSMPAADVVSLGRARAREARPLEVRRRAG